MRPNRFESSGRTEKPGVEQDAGSTARERAAAVRGSDGFNGVCEIMLKAPMDVNLPCPIADLSRLTNRF
jgi:hypothetical protein